MHCVKKYLEYVRDNPQNLWFKRKLYGWGWTPVRWQGWFVILAFVAVLVLSGMNLSLNAADGQPTDAMMTWFAIKIVVAIILLLLICYKKGEKPRWQWGIPDKE